ncbi:MAG: hypothetical protein ACLP1D_15530 [Xanthobacteraceae bacterium]
MVPVTSFSEYAPEPDPVTKKKDIIWFALSPDRPLFAFAGIWTEWTGKRGPAKNLTVDGPPLAYAFLSTPAECNHRADPSEGNARNSSPG